MYTILMCSLMFQISAETIQQTSKQDTKEPPKLRPEITETKFTAKLDDNSSLIGTLTEDAIKITTAYGVLDIPTKDISSITFGYRFDEEELDKLTKSLAGLGSAISSERESSQRWLVKQNHKIYPKINQLCKSSDFEVARRAQTIREWFIERYQNNLRNRDDDIVYTQDFPIYGRLNQKTIKLKTKHVGIIELKLDNIETLTSGNGKLYTAYTDRDWIEVAILTPNIECQIEAIGTVDNWPMQPNKEYMSSPNGLSNFKGKINELPSGALIGKIDNGPCFLVGTKSTITSKTGKLYLKINENAWNAPSSGQFSIAVRTY